MLEIIWYFTWEVKNLFFCTCVFLVFLIELYQLWETVGITLKSHCDLLLLHTAVQETVGSSLQDFDLSPTVCTVQLP